MIIRLSFDSDHISLTELNGSVDRPFSSPGHVTPGRPQSSILGPLLCSIFGNNRGSTLEAAGSSAEETDPKSKPRSPKVQFCGRSKQNETELHHYHLQAS